MLLKKNYVGKVLIDQIIEFELREPGSPGRTYTSRTRLEQKIQLDSNSNQVLAKKTGVLYSSRERTFSEVIKTKLPFFPAQSFGVT